MEIFYDAKDLQAQFQSLWEVDVFVLAPMVQVIIRRFLDDEITKHTAVYGVTDIKQTAVNERLLVIDGKIVNCRLRDKSVYVPDDGGKPIYFVSGIFFSGPETVIQRLKAKFKDFVQQQDINETRKTAAEELQKINTRHLGEGMKVFYLSYLDRIKTAEAKAFL